MAAESREPTTETLLFFLNSNSENDGLIQALKGFGYSMIFHQDDGTSNSLQVQNPVKVAIIEIDNSKELSEYRAKISAYKAKNSDTKFIAAIKSTVDFSYTELYKSGIDHIYRSPFENDLIINQIFEMAPIAVEDEDLSLSALAKVNILEFELNETLPFDLYIVLPSNKKILLYRRRNNPIEEKFIEKFKTNQKYNIYIKRSDLKEYQHHCASMINDLMQKESYSSIEKTKRIQRELNNLLQGFFDNSTDEQNASQIIHNVENILAGIPDPNGDISEIITHAENFACELLTNQTHARNVATYTAMFGMALGFKNPQSLRLGGFLHDIGLVDLSDDLVAKEREDMDEEEWAQYQLHPGAGKYTLDQSKIKIPEGVREIVTQHHEQPDGKGYPYGLESSKIHPYAKICAFADEFDKLTSVRIGYNCLTPNEALLRISGLDGSPPSPRYENSFHYPLVRMFLQSADSPEDIGDVLSNSNYYTDLNQGKLNLPEEREIREFIEACQMGDQEKVSEYIQGQFNLNVSDEYGRTGLMYAEIEGHYAIAEELIDSGADIYCQDLEGYCGFTHAVKLGQVKLVERCLKSSEVSPQNITLLTKKNESPLAIAIKTKNVSMVEALIANGINSEVLTDGSEKSVTEYCAEMDFHEGLACFGSTNSEPELEKPSAESKSESKLGPENVLPIAEVENSVDLSNMDKDVGRVKIKEDRPSTEQQTPAKGMDINFRNNKGQTYAHIAADKNRIDMLDSFQAMKGNLNCKDFNGRTPLFFASMKGHENVVDYLLEKGVQTGIKDDQGFSALVHAIQSGHSSIAIKLIAAGEKVNTKIKGVTPLMIAAYLGQDKVVKGLIEAGADPTIKDYKAKTAYHYALSKGHATVAEFLKVAS